MWTAVKQNVGAVDVTRVLLGWAAVVVMTIVAASASRLPAAGLAIALGTVVVIIVVCAFGVVKQAEALAHRLGDPYGTLVLTLSIVLIEVVLITAVMLGPGEHATIARDSVMAVSMIIMNLVIGLSLLVGGRRHGAMAHNRTGTSTYLAMLVVLSAVAFVLPGTLGTNGAYTPALQIPIVVLTLGLYAYFLIRQTGAQAADFREVEQPLEAAPATERPAIGAVLAEHRHELVIRLVLLVITALPIVLLSHDMATLLDDGLARLGAPVALAGVLIAMIVFLPESITSVRAALAGEAQRVSNLCHGALVSTVGLTIPAVLVVGLLTGQSVVLSESPTNLVLLGVTLVLSVATFAGRRVTAAHGAVHLALFAVYVMALFS